MVFNTNSTMGFMEDAPVSIWHSAKGFLVFKELIKEKMSRHVDFQLEDDFLVGFAEKAREILFATIVMDDMSYTSPPEEVRKAACNVVDMMLYRIKACDQSEDFKANGHKKLQPISSNHDLQDKREMAGKFSVTENELNGSHEFERRVQDVRSLYVLQNLV